MRLASETMSAARPSFAAIYDAHGAALAAFALNVTRCEADARDMVQEVFYNLFLFLNHHLKSSL